MIRQDPMGVVRVKATIINLIPPNLDMVNNNKVHLCMKSSSNNKGQMDFNHSIDLGVHINIFLAKGHNMSKEQME